MGVAVSETVYKKVDPSLRSLIDDIRMGEIALPDLQRPFVWKNAKIRNLFDSMYRGFPVGYLLFWEPAVITKVRTIGSDSKQKTPRLLVVDGQQRLTSLYAVLTGTAVLRSNYQAEKIEIAFNPLLAKFEVADAAIRRDPSYLPNITVIWEPGADIFEIAEKYIQTLSETREVTADEQRNVRKALNRIANLQGYPFTALELSSSVDEEQVSDVFVRINSEGKKLNQADFILTLMSVFWDAGRAELETFCRDARLAKPGEVSPLNQFIEPDPDQLLRVSVSLAFRRARLQYVYSILRGKDLETGVFSDERREEQFAKLAAAQTRVLNLQYWHDFLKALREAGFRSGRMISSQSNMLFAYILYLLGRTEFGVAEFQLRKLIARWFFMSALTGRYTSSPESAMEFDLARLRDVATSEDFVRILNEVCASTMTSDYWSITLPTELATSAAISPSKFAYYAALNILEARALYSTQKVSDLMDTSARAPRSATEAHHLFPKGYLERKGVVDSRDKNQIANYAIAEWQDNSEMSDRDPADYCPELEARFSTRDLERMYYWHALPDGWQHLEYFEFLRKRREKIAAVIRDAYEKLSGPESPDRRADHVSDLPALIRAGESTVSEFKSTMRMNLHTREPDPRMEFGVLKSIAGFVNSPKGGTLVIGLGDDGTALGIDADKFPNEDKMHLHLVNLIKDRLGANHMLYIHPHFDDYDEVRVLVVDCLPGRSPVFVKDGTAEKFFVRTGAATVELTGAKAQEFIAQRF